jgi:predicted TIM-barrel fold metal-dependent hydrolase
MTSRRRFLKLGLGSASALLGYSRVAPAGDLPLCFSQYAESGRVDVDVHCHIFNGSDLQVAAFLSKAAVREFPWWLRPLIQAMAPMLQAATWIFAPYADAEYKHLMEFGTGPRLRAQSSGALEEVAAKDAAEGTDRYARGLAKNLKTDDGKKFYEEYRKFLAGEVQRGSLDAVAAADFIRPELEELAQPEALKRRLQQEDTLGATPIFGFMHNFFQYRYINAYHALKNYGCDHGHVQIIAPALVDYDYGLGQSKSHLPSPLTTQMEVMERIALLFAGKVLPYAPFDPWRAAQGDTTVIDAAKAKIESGSLVGLKVYPPMGFAPLGNVDLQRPKHWPKDADFPMRLDRVLADTWTWAASKQVPVLSHSGQSNYAEEDFKNLGHPDNWATALRRFSDLRVCFGHSGGQQLLDGGWTLGFVGLTQKYSGAYMDVSYFSNVLTKKDRPGLRSRLSALIQKYPGTLERLVYGSDWIMLALEKNSQFFYEDIVSMINDKPPFPADLLDRMMSANALNFLGLHQGSAGRTRLDTYYRNQGIPVPWAGLVS